MCISSMCLYVICCSIDDVLLMHFCRVAFLQILCVGFSSGGILCLNKHFIVC